MQLILAAIIAICAILVRFNPALINTLSDEERKRMDIKKTGRAAFWGLFSIALTLAILNVIGVRHELTPIFVIIPGVFLTVLLIEHSIPKE